MTDLIAEAEKRLQTIRAVIAQCELGRRHVYGCPYDGYPMAFPAPADCVCAWKDDPCELCRERLDDATTIEQLIAALRGSPEPETTDLRRWARHEPSCPCAAGWRWIGVASRCDCGLAKALADQQEAWNPDLTTAPRDARIKLQLPPYVTGHVTTVVSVEPIAWAPAKESK